VLYGLLVAALLTACTGGTSTSEPVATPQSLTKITFNMAWLPQGSMVGVIAAIDQGFYAKRGLEVEAVRGFGGIRTTNEVDQGMFDFGYGDPLSVILNRANGGQTRLVGVINERWPAGLCFLRERHQLKGPADLKGLTVGGGQNSAVQVLLPVWLRRNDVDPATVKVLQLNPSVIVASLIEGQIDAAECWRGNSYPLFEQQARAAGVTLDWVEYGAHNLDIYGSGLITTDRAIRERPDVVKAFVAATFEGYRFARANPELAREIMLKSYPMLDAGVTAAQISEILELQGGSAGLATDAKMAQTLEFVAAAYPLPNPVAVQDIYSNTFVTP